MSEGKYLTTFRTSRVIQRSDGGVKFPTSQGKNSLSPQIKEVETLIKSVESSSVNNHQGNKLNLSGESGKKFLLSNFHSTEISVVARIDGNEGYTVKKEVKTLGDNNNIDKQKKEINKTWIRGTKDRNSFRGVSNIFERKSSLRVFPDKTNSKEIKPFLTSNKIEKQNKVPNKTWMNYNGTKSTIQGSSITFGTKSSPKLIPNGGIKKEIISLNDSTKTINKTMVGSNTYRNGTQRHSNTLGTKTTSELIFDKGTDTREIKTSIFKDKEIKKNINDGELQENDTKITPKKKLINFLSNKSRVTEKAIEVRTKKVFKDGKWMEETTKTETVSDDGGSKKISEKTSYKDLPLGEIRSPDKGKAPTPTRSPTPEPVATPEAEKLPPAKKKVAKTTKRRAKESPPVKDDPESFARQVLVATNSYRKLHGVAPLQLSEKLTKMAKEFSEKLSKMEKMEHGTNKDIGENIYCKTSSQPWFQMSGSEVVDNWYNEVDDHNYNEEPKQGFLKTGHFTQLVWKDTKEMGVAFSRNKNGHMAFVVAYFSPKGNWIGEFKEQVFPQGGAPKTTRARNSSQKSVTSTAKITITSRPSSDSSTKSKPQSKPGTSSSTVQTGRKTGTADSQSSNRSSSSATSQIDSPVVTPQSSRSTASKTSDSGAGSKAGTPASVKSEGNSITSATSYTSRNTINTPDSISSRNTRNSGTRNKQPFSSPIRQNTSSSVLSIMSVAEENFYEDCLEAHNYYRKRHGVPALRLNDKLSKFAQSWADNLASKDEMAHRVDNDYGENIYMKWSPNPNFKIPGEEAVDSWYEEIADYEFGKEPLDLSAGHFTQVIWADTEELGVGVAKSKQGKIYVVANYDPPGNYIGQFSKKVPPPL